LGLSFGAAKTISSNSAASNPLISINGDNFFIGWSFINASNLQEVDGVSLADGGATWTTPFQLHLNLKTTDTSSFGSLGFLGQTDPIAFEVGANEVGSTSGTLAFADFGDSTGLGGFTTQTIGSGFFAGAGYSRSDSLVEVGAINASDNSTHLLQGHLPSGGPFSDLTASTDKAMEVSISGDDSDAFIVQTINSVPGPIEVIHCH